MELSKENAVKYLLKRVENGAIIDKSNNKIIVYRTGDYPSVYLERNIDNAHFLRIQDSSFYLTKEEFESYEEKITSKLSESKAAQIEKGRKKIFELINEK